MINVRLQICCKHYMKNSVHFIFHVTTTIVHKTYFLESYVLWYQDKIYDTLQDSEYTNRPLRKKFKRVMRHAYF